MDQVVIFAPKDSTYELHLQSGKDYDGPINSPIDLVVRGTARKVYTVPSGGLFVSPIRGTPKILQGRVKSFDEKSMVVNCGVLVTVDLPREAGAVELARGQIAEGTLVNVVLQPGARCEVIA